MNDQTVKADAGKLQLSLVPPAIITSIAKVRQHGSVKYGDPDNWKKVEIERYWDAVLRHICAAWNDFRAKDPESGLMHIEHASCDLAFMLQMLSEEGWVLRQNGLYLDGENIVGKTVDILKSMGVTPVAAEPDPAKIESEPEPEPEEPKPQKRKTVDRGRIKALRAAGWEMKEIAEDVGCAYNTVWKVLHDEE